MHKIILAIMILLISIPGFSQKKKKVSKDKITKDKIICFAMYTVQNNIMKMNVQFYPLDKTDSRTARLEIMKEGEWTEIGKVQINENDYGMKDKAKSWTALFRIEKWDHSQNWKYRVVHGTKCFYDGLIRKDPKDKNEIVVAAFTGNSNRDRSLKPDIIHNIKAHNPDLLFFSGDQSYDHKTHLKAWLLFGRQFGEIIRNTPTVAIPDDHDIGQGNVWGHGGKKAKSTAGNDGGYFYSSTYVNEVQRAQTANLPDPFDPTPVLRGIGVYYTSLNIGGIDFAIIEDRKWKTGPNGLIPKMGPRPDHINDPKYDPKAVDVPEARLLGERQLKFLDAWGTKWQGAKMKAVLSQTVFANAAHIHHGKRLIADLDSNGWPQTGRNKALDSIRKSYSFMIGGDQHLATVIHHGIDAWNDSGFSFCVPSIVNYYPRKWLPLETGLNPIPNKQKHTGQFKDGFHNKVTMYAYANPGESEELQDKWRANGKWGKLAAGHGIVRFNKEERTIIMECWPRGVDVTKKDAKQMKGWPIKITQEQNYGRKAAAYLPTIEVSGMTDPVVQVIDETTKKLVYSLRIKGERWTPKVFKTGKYTIKVGNQDGKDKVFSSIEATKEKSNKTLKANF